VRKRIQRRTDQFIRLVGQRQYLIDFSDYGKSCFGLDRGITSK
jgi:hypothetical protein